MVYEIFTKLGWYKDFVKLYRSRCFCRIFRILRFMRCKVWSRLWFWWFWDFVKSHPRVSQKLNNKISSILKFIDFEFYKCWKFLQNFWDFTVWIRMSFVKFLRFMIFCKVGVILKFYRFVVYRILQKF